MSDTIQNDYQLDQYAQSCARDILAEIAEYGGNASDMAHEHSDGSEHVIYHHKAHAICQNCNTDNGEAFLEDVGNPETVTYNNLATVIAYGELCARIENAIAELQSESEAA
jgi:hypothetical protein